tara:strand:+ start:4704 stop:6029 length:1326 start_codon:yes stop_codon:yes gene_type:complete
MDLPKINIPLDRLSPGHVAIYGPTESGKTQYAMKLIKEVIRPDHIVVFLGSEDRTWANAMGGEIECHGKLKPLEFDPVIAKVRQQATARNATGRATIVVFDDYNTDINSTNSASYNQLFTAGRHCGIRIINMSQTAKGIGKDARGNVRYFFSLHMSNMEYVKDLAGFINIPYAEMQTQYNSIQGSRNVIVFDSKLRAIGLDNANNYGDPIVDNDVIAVVPRGNGQRFGNGMQMNGMPGQQMQGQQMYGQQGMQGQRRNDMQANDSINAGMTRNVLNNGTYNDNSQIHFQNNIEVQKRIEMNLATQEITTQNYEFQRGMKARTERDEVFDLLMQYRRNKEEFMKICTVLARELQTASIAVAEDFPWHAQLFLDEHYPGNHYKQPPKALTLITENLELITAPTANNMVDTAARFASSAATKRKNDRSLIGQIIRNTPLRMLTE